MNVLHMSLRELVRRRQGVLLSLLLVLCAAATLTAVWTLRDATMQRVRRVMAQMGNNLLFLPATADPGAYFAATGSQELMDESLADYLYHHPVTGHHGTHYVARVQRRVPAGGGEVILTGFRVVAGGHRPGEDKARRRSFLDDPLADGHVIVGSEAAGRLGAAAGEPIELLGRGFTISRVIGELGEMDDLRVWANLAEIQDMLGLDGKVHAIDALGCWGDGSYLEPIQQAVQQDDRLAGLRLFHSDLIARTRIRARVAVEQVGLISGLIVAVLVGVGLFVNTLFEMRDRRSEIGILGAMGAGGGHLALLFVPKLLLVGLAGGGLGWAAGSALAAWIAPMLGTGLEEVRFRLLVGLLPVCLAGGALLTCLAGGLAVWRGGRLDPVLALREL